MAAVLQLNILVCHLFAEYSKQKEKKSSTAVLEAAAGHFLWLATDLRSAHYSPEG